LDRLQLCVAAVEGAALMDVFIGEVIDGMSQFLEGVAGLRANVTASIRTSLCAG
jgi:hypothetical protein